MSFADDGFVHLKGFFDGSALDKIERTISGLFLLQAKKLPAAPDYLGKVEISPKAQLEAIIDALEDTDKDALYQVQKFLPQSQGVRELYNPELIAQCAELLGVDESELLVEGPNLFINKPKTFRLLYKWHAESIYYPKRRRFVNLWIPLFGPKDQDNGAMQLLPGSHKETWSADRMSEYDNGPDTFRQYEIPSQFLTQYKPHSCTSERGDIVIFDRSLVHKSTENTTRDYSFALVARVWTPKDDLTTAGDMAATPYGGAGKGRANMRVAA